MDYKTYYQSLARDQREAYASAAGTTTNYIEIHLLASPSKRKTPRGKLMQSLVDACDGKCSLDDLLRHFYSTEAA